MFVILGNWWLFSLCWYD